MRLRAPVVLFILIFAFLSCAMASAADDGTYSVREYSLPAGAGEIGAMTVDKAGNVWLIQNETPVLYKFVRENSTFSNYTIDGFAGAKFAGMSVDELGIAWFTDLASDGFGAYDERDNQTSHFPFNSWMAMVPSSIIRQGDTVWIGCDAEVGEYDLRFPDEPLLDHFVDKWYSSLCDIHFSRLGDIWFVENAMNKVGVYWHVYDQTSEFVIPTDNSHPTCLSIDSLGRMWFVENATNKLGMFHTELFNFSEYDMPLIDGSRPAISRVATVGDTVWLTDMKNGRVLRFYPDEGRFAAATLANGTMPTFIEPDANGTLWIYETGSKKLAALNVTEQFGRATPTPTPGPTTTGQPSPTTTAQPTKTPGFLALITIVALILAVYSGRVKK